MKVKSKPLGWAEKFWLPKVIVENIIKQAIFIMLWILPVGGQNFFCLSQRLVLHFHISFLRVKLVLKISKRLVQWFGKHRPSKFFMTHSIGNFIWSWNLLCLYFLIHCTNLFKIFSLSSSQSKSCNKFLRSGSMIEKCSSKMV